MADNTELFTPNTFDNVTGKYYNREVVRADAFYVPIVLSPTVSPAYPALVSAPLLREME